jgi:two-component system response regulator FlrC
MNKTRLLIVEDDPTLRMALVDTLASNDTEIFEAPNGKEALALLMRESIDLVLSDVQMDEMDGTELLAHVRQHYPNLPFIMMTAHGTVQHAVAAMRDGATDYLQKPFEASVLKALVERMAATNRVSGQDMIAEDPATQAVLALATRVAQSEAAVMISGESGSGKEVLARVIHEQSPRASGPFVALNCAAIPETMLESILFGYEKGAFTGAQSAQAGKFEQANGGTLLLDEISEMALELQAKLLRVLQEREVERLGGKATIPLDVRVLATTNRSLSEEVAAGRFREDLYFRLNVFPLSLPALRDRPADILPLARRFAMRHSGDAVIDFAEDAKALLLSHQWRGNVRELDNCIHRAVIMASKSLIDAKDLFFDDLVVLSDESVDEAQKLLDGDLKARERDVILSALAAVNGNRKQACEKLGISERSLRYKLAKYRDAGVELPAAVA